MDALFSGDKLKQKAITEIGLMRYLLDSIEKHVNEDDRCVDAANVLYLGESFAKLSYTIGMFNNLRLRERQAAREEAGRN